MSLPTTIPIPSAVEDDGDIPCHPGRRMSEEEFVEWSGPQTRAEWVDGEVVMMAPVSFRHADLSAWLMVIIRAYARRKDLGIAIGGEFFIRFNNQRRLPDILFLSKARLGILRKNHIEGAPDLVIEIVSPESESRDWREKYIEYERVGVAEYWVIDPMSRRAEVYGLIDGKYLPLPEQGGRLASRAIAGFYIRTEWLWQEPLPMELDVLRELGA